MTAIPESDLVDDDRIAELRSRLALDEKVRLLTGRDFWSTVPLPSIGLRSMVLSDGPSGVRGAVWDERSPSLSLPSATALSSAWDRDLAVDYGTVAAGEARRKGVDVVLGPTINLHRSPLGGRHFEAFSEDPVLTAELGAAYVRGVQQNGVAATPKHYVANDFETERFTVDVVVADRVLRELYLLAFEKAVVDAGAWVVMSAYNGINGVTASENGLLETPLNSEWGFDGVVVSDWTAVRSLESARHSQDLVMPGPRGPWGEALVSAVRAGEVDEAVIDRKVDRILKLAARVGALEGFPAARVPVVIDGADFARRAEVAGMVLAANDGILPLGRPGSIAVIGHHAVVPRSQGGGSATVVPEYVVSPLEGIVAAFPDAEVRHAVGAVVQSGVEGLPLDELRNPATGDHGVRVRFLDAAGDEIFVEDRRATSYVWIGGDAPVEATTTIEMTTSWTPSRTGMVRLGFSGVGEGVIVADGEIVVSDVAVAVGSDLGAALLSPPTVSGDVAVEAGRTIDLRVRFTRQPVEGDFAGAMAFAFGCEADDRDPERGLAEAEELARTSDVVVLVVGTTASVESEGFDRADLALPGLQDELARRVLAANPRTIAIVNAGSPVELPWADDAAAVLLAWFGGQEFGSALGDVLSGAAEPGGRLPTTWPRSLADAPVAAIELVDGRVHYDEGIHIGYRAWLAGKAAPRYWFGHGLGYTTFDCTDPIVSGVLVPGGTIEVTTTVSNTGARRGKHVVQLYASRPDSAVERPVRWLVGFAAVTLDPGASEVVSVTVDARALAHWDAGWREEPGLFEIAVASSASDSGRVVPVELAAPTT